MHLILTMIKLILESSVKDQNPEEMANYIKYIAELDEFIFNTTGTHNIAIDFPVYGMSASEVNGPYNFNNIWIDYGEDYYLDFSYETELRKLGYRLV